MAYTTLIETSTLSNQSLATALLVHTFTNTTRVRKVWININIDQVAGNGDYIAHITKQIAGVGSFYTSIKTTLALASGVTSGFFSSIPLIIGATDVVKVYVIGLAGDTTTPDIITNIYEEWESIDASGRVDVGAILGTAQTAGDVVAKVAVVDGIVDSILVDTGTDIPAGIDALPTAAEVWASATRTLTQSAAQVAAIVDGSEITVVNYASIIIALTGLGNLTGDTQIWFTVKGLTTHTDAEAILQIGYVGGLLYLNGAAPIMPITAEDGELAVDNAANGDITITLSFDAAALLLAVTDLHYDIKALNATAETIAVLTSGQMNVVQTVTHALE